MRVSNKQKTKFGTKDVCKINPGGQSEMEVEDRALKNSYGSDMGRERDAFIWETADIERGEKLDESNVLEIKRKEFHERFH